MLKTAHAAANSSGHSAGCLLAAGLVRVAPLLMRPAWNTMVTRHSMIEEQKVTAAFLKAGSAELRCAITTGMRSLASSHVGRRWLRGLARCACESLQGEREAL